MVKLTKNELKVQKDQLKRFRRYLPTLQLKKQQLQLVIRQVETKVKEKQLERDALYEDMLEWIAVFGEGLDPAEVIALRSIDTDMGNIAGVDIPVFRAIHFDVDEYSLLNTAPWFDKGVDVIKSMVRFDTEIRILEQQVKLLSEELRITSQRVNLFEKIKIPETRENIRVISIYLGDQQTAAVVRGKIAKGKVQKGGVA